MFSGSTVHRAARRLAAGHAADGAPGQARQQAARRVRRHQAARGADGVLHQAGADRLLLVARLLQHAAVGLAHVAQRGQRHGLGGVQHRVGQELAHRRHLRRLARAARRHRGNQRGHQFADGTHRLALERSGAGHGDRSVVGAWVALRQVEERVLVLGRLLAGGQALDLVARHGERGRREPQRAGHFVQADTRRSVGVARGTGLVELAHPGAVVEGLAGQRANGVEQRVFDAR
jgi:hypothetical protein